MRIVCAVGVACSLSLTVLGLAPASQAAKAVGQVVVIQAVPGMSVDVAIDGKSMDSGVEVGTVLGPFDLTPGSHEVEFSGSGLAVKSSIDVASGSSSDVVIHRPAAVGGDPVVHSFAAPVKPIGPGKARVLLAHTATVAPADVRVDGKVAFTNIANGEFAEADVPAGAHKVELLPTGLTKNPIVGPLDVDLKARTLTMVYAVGSPKDQSMNVIVHTAQLASDGSTMPETMDTGSAGLAADARVTPFSPGGGPADAGASDTLLWPAIGLGALLAGFVLLWTAGIRLRPAAEGVVGDRRWRARVR